MARASDSSPSGVTGFGNGTLATGTRGAACTFRSMALPGAMVAPDGGCRNDTADSPATRTATRPMDIRSKFVLLKRLSFYEGLFFSS